MSQTTIKFAAFGIFSYLFAVQVIHNMFSELIFRYFEKVKTDTHRVDVKYLRSLQIHILHIKGSFKKGSSLKSHQATTL